MTSALTSVVAEVSVAAVRRLSPSFVRVELASPALADLGVDGPWYDQRIKLLFPTEEGLLPSFAGREGDWWDAWRAMPVAERGHMRTYSVRDVLDTGSATRLVVDFVLHLAPGRTGPASRWAAGARAGDRLVVVGPRRGVATGGIEFDPGDAARLLLAGDETAVPAICRILTDLPAGSVGHAFLECPGEADVLPAAAPDGMVVSWLPRGARTHGQALTEAVTACVGRPAPGPLPAAEPPPTAAPDIWETPTYSSSGEPLAPTDRQDLNGGLYAWIAGESGVVTRLRRHLVGEAGLDRGRVAFMGYWREGVAMG